MTVKNLFKKLVPGVLAVALTAGAVAPAVLTLAGVKDAFVATASAEETALRKIRFLGGALGDTITMKVIFCADDEVEYVTIKNPNTGNEDKFYQGDWKVYEGDDEYSNDYYVEMPVYPKNMATSMTFKMYNAAGNALHFGNSQTIMPDDYDYDEKNFSANSYLEQVRDSVMSGDSIKENATDKEKATYDLSRALLNYGEWCRFYFTKVDEPTDGKYVAYDPKTESPSYPSWWVNNNYWAGNELGEYASFNKMLEAYAPPTVSYGEHENKSTDKLNHPYVISLVLEEGVKIRIYVSTAQYNPSVIPSAESGVTVKQITTYNDWSGVITQRCFETTTINFGTLNNPIDFNVLGYWNDMLNDTVTLSPIGYANLVAVDKARVITTYEQSGLANALRAMVTVEAAVERYKSIN